jgi:regulatory protein
VEHANEVAKTCGRMVRMLSTSPKSTRELDARLTKSGVHPNVVKEALELLGQIGMVSDKRLAEQVIETQRRKGRSQAAVQRELSRRGLSAPVEALEQEELLAAMAVAREAATRVPPEADATTRWRRVLGALNRRGFDEDTADEAARVILGDAPEPTVE